MKKRADLNGLPSVGPYIIANGNGGERIPRPTAVDDESNP